MSRQQLISDFFKVTKENNGMEHGDTKKILPDVIVVEVKSKSLPIKHEKRKRTRKQNGERSISEVKPKAIKKEGPEVIDVEEITSLSTQNKNDTNTKLLCSSEEAEATSSDCKVERIEPEVLIVSRDCSPTEWSDWDDGMNVMDSPVPTISNHIFDTPTTSAGSLERTESSPRKSPKKRLSNADLDLHSLTVTIQRMNQHALATISETNYNLESIYNDPSPFFCNYENEVLPDITASSVYQLRDIQLPVGDLYRRLLFNVITSVFSKAVNYCYFSKDELQLVYSILTLPEEAGMLFVRMLKRQRGWFRKSSLQYEEITADVSSLLKTLFKSSLCTSEQGMKGEESLKTLLSLLATGELNLLCRNLNLNTAGKKEDLLNRVCEFARSKILFSNHTQARNVRRSALKLIQCCAMINGEVWKLIDKIITLYIPVPPDGKYGSMTVADMFYLMMDWNPVDYIIETRPVFSSEEHLTSYIEAVQTYAQVETCLEKREWEKVTKIGNLAQVKVHHFLRKECTKSTLPKHMKKFTPGYIWLKVLSSSIAAYKKCNDIPKAVNILNLLISPQNCYMESVKGKWYNELALILMNDRNSLEICAIEILEAMNLEMNIVDKVDLLERAARIANKKGNDLLKPETRVMTKSLVEAYEHLIPSQKFTDISVTVEGSFMSGKAGYKSHCRIETGDGAESYGSVEDRAIYYYMTQGYKNYCHCENNLPVTLFTLLFWKELYQDYIPGGFLSRYQIAPQDLFSSQFYENRKESIDEKFEGLRNYDSLTISNLMRDTFDKYSEYRSILPGKFNIEQIEEIVHCLGVQAVLGICKKILSNYNLWKAGFPDLIVWNPKTNEYKIVEVKGPRDTLSTKQRCWLQYLREIGIITEVCYVQSK